MKFFDIFPENFFSVLTSPNKRIYIEALFVLRNVYMSSPVMTKEELVSSLIANLENQILELQSEDNIIALEDNLSSRAHFLLRKFQDTGWLEREHDAKSFSEQYIIPIYASKLLNLLYDIIYGRTIEYNGFVYSTYSIMKTADEERGEYMYDGLRQAHQLTGELQNALRELLANLRFYHQRLQEQYTVQEILAEHFDLFRQKISDKIYHPLKTFDSIPRFKSRILKIVKAWLLNPEIIENLASAAYKRGAEPDMQLCRQRVIAMLGEIQDIYQDVDRILLSIDKKNSAYTRASVERMQYYLNSDRDSKGKLVEILKKLPRLTGREEIPLLAEGLPLFQQRYIDEEALYTEPRKRRLHQPRERALDSRINEDDLAAAMREFEERLRNTFSHRKVLEYILQQLQKQGILRSADLQLYQDEDFIKLILAVLKTDEREIPYTIRFEDGYLVVNGYRLPQMLITKEPEGTGA